MNTLKRGSCVAPWDFSRPSDEHFAQRLKCDCTESLKQHSQDCWTKEKSTTQNVGKLKLFNGFLTRIKTLIHNEHTPSSAMPEEPQSISVQTPPTPLIHPHLAMQSPNPNSLHTLLFTSSIQNPAPSYQPLPRQLNFPRSLSHLPAPFRDTDSTPIT